MTGLVPLRRNRDFVLYQSGQFFSIFGSQLSRIAYPLLALALTNSAAAAGYVGAAELAPLVLLNAPAGVLADRFDRRKLMIASDVVGAGALGVLAAILLAHHGTFWLVMVVAFVDMAASVLFANAASGANTRCLRLRRDRRARGVRANVVW